MDWNAWLLIQKPACQALLFLLLTPVLIFAIQPKSVDTAWVIAMCTFVLFLAGNAVMLWFNDNSTWRYFFYSIGSAVGYLLLIAIIMPGILNVLKLKGSGESAMAFLVLIYQPFLLLFVMLVKWVVMKWF